MVEAQGDVATTAIVRPKQQKQKQQQKEQQQSRSKSQSKPHHEPSTAPPSTIASSPRKWTLFHRGNRNPPSKKPITLFQSRRRRQKQHNQSPSQNSQSTDRALPINDSEFKKGILRRATNKQKATVQVPAPTGTSFGTNHGLQLPVSVPTDQSAAAQTNSNPNPTMKQSDSDLQAHSSQRTRFAADMSTRTGLAQSGPLSLPTTDAGAGTGTGTDSDLQGSERAVLIFDRDKRASTSDETIQDKKVKPNRFTIVGKAIGAVLLIGILYWLVVYLSTKIIEGGQHMISMYHNFTSRMHTLGHVLRVGITISAWGGTIAGWGYLVKNTKKFIERRRSDINPTLVDLNNAGAHIADQPDDYAFRNQLEKRSNGASFQGNAGEQLEAEFNKPDRSYIAD